MDESDKSEAINYLQKCIDTKASKKLKSKNRRSKSEGKANQKLYLKRTIYKETIKSTIVKAPVLKCKICSETKPNKQLLLKHLETHIGTPVTCIKCRRSFNNNVAFEWHIRHVCNLKRKSGIKTFKCNECPKVSKLCLSSGRGTGDSLQ